MNWVTLCFPHQGPRLPFFLHVKKFSPMDQAFETAMDNMMYKQVKGPLVQLLGGKLYSTRICTHIGYTIGKLQTNISYDKNEACCISMCHNTRN